MAQIPRRDTSSLPPAPEFAHLAQTTISRCRALAEFTETPGAITRTFLSQPTHDCHRAVSCWMQELGLRVSLDAIGNLRGLQGTGKRPRLLLGSHLDTVPNAGALDGVLGVCLALSVLEALAGVDLPFDVEVLAFSEEEGVRFRTPFLGSLAAIGRFDAELLELHDDAGSTLRQALEHFGLDPNYIPSAQIDPHAFAYLEFHIEQGPLLERAGQSLAAVEAIAGQSRLEIVFAGQANHAGTTPMDSRQDALAGAAEWITSVEEHARAVPGLVATVGKLQVSPGAANVIPAEALASLDVRHAHDATRIAAVQALCASGEKIAAARSLRFRFAEQVNQKAVWMDEPLINLIEQALIRMGETPRRMVSGAGHDAMIMAERVPSAMIFLRSIGGISHHPDESVQLADVERAIRLGTAMLTDLATSRSNS